MEGISLSPLRSEHSRLFPGIDRYFSPFLSANQTLHFHRSEIRDILPENNQGLTLIPQILTCKADQMIWAARELGSYGYREIDLNLGCPMPQVAKRGKGAGFLADPGELDRFFDEVFPHLDSENLLLSVKTRIGISHTEEAYDLIRIYNRYPISELIIHPRLMDELYRGTPHMDVFADLLGESVNPVCYNGDICCTDDLDRLVKAYPGLDRVMIGRGLLKDPALVSRLKGNIPAPDTLTVYHDRLFENYLRLYPDPRQAVSKMKDIWSFWIESFPECQKEYKKLRKSTRPEQYLEQAHELLSRSKETPAKQEPSEHQENQPGNGSRAV